MTNEDRKLCEMLQALLDDVRALEMIGPGAEAGCRVYKRQGLLAQVKGKKTRFMHRFGKLVGDKVKRMIGEE